MKSRRASCGGAGTIRYRPMAQKDLETIIEGLKADTKARFVGLFDALEGNAIATSGDNAGHTGKDFVFEIRHQTEGDTLMITRGGVYCRRYRIWFRPNHVLGVLLSDKIDVGPVRDKAR